MFCVSMRRGEDKKCFEIAAKDHKEAFQWGKIQAKQLGRGWQVTAVEAAGAMTDARKAVADSNIIELK